MGSWFEVKDRSAQAEPINFGKKPESGQPVLVGTCGDRASHGRDKLGIVRDLEEEE